MCYHTKLKADAVSVAAKLNAEFLEVDTYSPMSYINGFEFPQTPVVRHDERKIIQYYEWGMLGDYLTYKGFEKNSPESKKARVGCLNARIEELEQKATYKSKINNRCIIPMDGMFEWQWANPDATKSDKTKYLITAPGNGVFCAAGLFNEWKDPKTGFTTYCYTIVTTEGNQLMKQIHNHGERMLVVLNEDEYDHWLNPEVPYMAFWDRSHIELKAEIAEPKQITLF
jgi:putative SOS response-associated peptidase YedK